MTFRKVFIARLNTKNIVIGAMCSTQNELSSKIAEKNVDDSLDNQDSTEHHERT